MSAMAPKLCIVFIGTVINHPYLTVGVIIESHAAQVYEAISSGHFPSPLKGIIGLKDRTGAVKDGGRITYPMGPVYERVKSQHLLTPHKQHVLTQDSALTGNGPAQNHVPTVQGTQYQSLKRRLLYKGTDIVERAGGFIRGCAPSETGPVTCCPALIANCSRSVRRAHKWLDSCGACVFI